MHDQITVIKKTKEHSDLSDNESHNQELFVGDVIRGASFHPILLCLATCRLVYLIAGILCLQYHLVMASPQEYGGKMAAVWRSL